MASARSQRGASILNAGLFSANLDAQTKQQQGFLDKGLAGLGLGVDKARSDITGGLANSLSALGAGYNTGVQAVNQGFNDATGSVRQGIGVLDPWVQQGQAASGMQGNALGLNGASGNQAATSAFQASPGYQWNVDQATDAAARKANALGISASGNTLDALTRLGSNLANQEYGSWYDRLTGLSTQGQSAANSQLAGYQNLASLQAQRGGALAQLGQNYGQNQASAHNNAGNALASAAMTQGTSTGSLYDSMAGRIANISTNAINGITSGNMAAAAATDSARNANSNLPLAIGGQLLGSAGSIFTGLGNLGLGFGKQGGS